jgi:flagellin
MSTSINTNISALAAQSSLRKTGLAQDTAMERLSTGTRINNAKDDAAGLAITNRMTANIRGMAAAIRNANDGISLTQTAEGSMSVIGDNLQRIRELAVQSANTGNNASDRAALNAEATQLIAEIDRVATNSAFNGIKLLDGSFQNQGLQIGAGNEANDRISISIGSAKANSLGLGGGAGVGAKLTGVQVGNAALSAGSLAINGFMVTAASADGVSAAYADTSGIAVANAINAVSSQSGVSAQVSATKTNTVYTGFQAAVHGAGAFTAGSVTINGVDIGAVSAGTDSATQGANVVAAINAKSDLSGVTATHVGGKLTLTAADGRDIVIGGAATDADLLADTGLKAGTYAAGSKAGGALVDGAADVANGSLDAGDLIINGVSIGAVTGSATLATQVTNVLTAVNALSDQTGVKAYSTGNKISFYSVTGGAINIKSGDTDAKLAKAVLAVGLTTGGQVSRAGVDYAAGVTNLGALADDSVRINGVNIGAIGAAGTAAERGSQMSAAINAKSSQTGVTATFSSTSGAVSLTAVDGRNIITSVNGQAARITTAMTGLSHSEGSGTVGTRVETVLRSTVSLTSNSPSGITVGAVTSNATTATGLTAGNKAAVSSPGSNTVDISTATGAQSALTVLDKAINTVTDSRASMGAYQNRLTAAIANLETTSMNLQASRSRILDTDYAKETTNLAKTQIITQAATAMLAQANQSSQSVLALLK